jgi:large subunit ribosomal protein L3
MGKRAHHPRRGSLGYSPRKRAKRPTGRIRSWIDGDRPRMQGFCGYKVGTTHVIMADDFKNSPTHGEEIAVAATVVETPPMVVCGVRAYKKESGSLKVLKEVWAKKLHEDLGRLLPTMKGGKGIKELEKVADQAVQLRLIVHTLPRLASVPKKKPELMEFALGGSIQEGLELAGDVLGKEVKISDVFSDGEYVDIIGVTKGKGFQGPVKRWGVKILPPKTRKGHRTAGTLGPWHPAAMMWRVPQAGQMGYHQRTELNKRILKVGSNGEEVNPAGGFINYGLVKGDYVLIAGSIPGPKKRLVRLRPAVRPPKKVPEGVPQISHISRASKQGV